ncbi:MAG: hypothetical protein K2N20_06850, partial [Helicobacter sp.]|nr:hypothetical protein [Helicobacter sp.]
MAGRLESVSNGRLRNCGIKSAALCCALLTCARFFWRFLEIGVSLRASNASVAINEQRIPSEQESNTVDCFGQRPRNDT